MPALSCASARRRSSSPVARRSTSHCARSTASGVRSSCAASAVKRRSRSSVDSMRVNSPFMADSIGCSSCGACVHRHRTQVVGAAALQLGGQHAHRLQRAPHRPGHGQQQHRQHQQPGQQLAAHQVAHQFVAFGAALPGGHQPFAVRRLQVVHAPGLAVELHVDEAGGIGAARQLHAFAVDQQQLALAVPHRDGQVAQVGLAGRRRRRQRLARRGGRRPAWPAPAAPGG